MPPKQRIWCAFLGRYERVTQKRSMPIKSLQLRHLLTGSVVMWIVRFVAPALQLDLTKVIWNCSMTFFALWYSKET